MASRRKLTVIVDQGRVVGLQWPADQADTAVGQPAVSTRLTAGPGQTRHEVHVEPPPAFKTEAARGRFHARLLAAIKAQRG
jgi:hypothetical protein